MSLFSTLKSTAVINTTDSDAAYTPHPSRKNIRRSMRQKRRSLSIFDQRCASKKLYLNLQKTLKRFNRTLSQKKPSTTPLKVGVYLASDGEIDPCQDLIKTKAIDSNSLNNQLANFYFPIIKKNKTLLFGMTTRGKLPRINIYGIAEPHKTNGVPIHKLDIILLPLVAASISCDRLGMGGGFYDRTLSQLSQNRLKPVIVGIAHDFQVINHIPTEPWDQPLQVIVTDQRVIMKKG